MITAKKRKNDYPDIAFNKEYVVESIGTHIKFKDNPRHYQISCFRLYKDGEPITADDAKKYLKIKAVRERLGMK